MTEGHSFLCKRFFYNLIFQHFIRFKITVLYSVQNVYIVTNDLLAVRGEEGEWGEWSQWKGCENETDSVATRTRKCYTKYTYQVTNIDRCLLIPGNKGDLDIMPCRLFRTLSTHPSSTAAFKSSQNISTENPHSKYQIGVVDAKF